MGATGADGTVRRILDRHDAGARQDLYGLYAELRAAGPVVHSATAEAWVLSRHAEVVDVLRAPSGWSSDFRRSTNYQREVARGRPTGLADMLSMVLLFMDPPAHTRMRSLVAKAFTPRAVQQLGPRIEAIAAGLVDHLRDRDRIELLDDFAFPLTVTVICELLGVPVEDRGLFREHVPALTQLIEWEETSEDDPALVAAVLTLWGYLTELVEKRSADPGDDILSVLLRAEEDGDRLSREEVLVMVVLLLAAGHETTLNLLGNGVLALLRAPDQRRRLVDDPGLVPGAVEELLRYDSPVQLTARVATAPVEVGGQEVAAGDQVVLLIGSANHDPAAFPDPERLDVARGSRSHVSFGYGAHHCLGAALARSEAAIALRHLLGAFPALELAGEPRWRPSSTLRGLERLDLTG
jgi:cytochrome P450